MKNSDKSSKTFFGCLNLLILINRPGEAGAVKQKAVSILGLSHDLTPESLKCSDA